MFSPVLAKSSLIGHRWGCSILTASKRLKKTDVSIFCHSCYGCRTIGAGLASRTGMAIFMRSRLQLPFDIASPSTPSQSPIYRVYRSMIARCENPNFSSFPRYGGRGIRVCDRWRKSFYAFLGDMGPRPDGCVRFTIERKDNQKNYEPGNCKWATYIEQNNNKRTTIFFEHNGKRQTLGAWAKELGISTRTLWLRRNMGWSDERVVTTPINAGMCSRPNTKLIQCGATQEHINAAQTNGVCFQTFYGRLMRGWTPEKASSVPPTPANRRRWSTS